MTAGQRPELRLVPDTTSTIPSTTRTSTKDEDAELVRAMRAGDAHAAMEIYRLHASAAEKMIVRMLGYVPERVDLLHDVFVRVLEGIDSLKDPSSLRAWISGIAVRRAQEHIRTRKRAMSELPADAVAWTGDPEVSLTMRRVYALIDRLDVDERAAFVLRRIEGMELQEIATLVETSLATVKRRIARAEKLFEEWAAADPVLREKVT
ncbi:MAG: RNA polymerase sigma factor [Sandaracinaceae bacterium]|jgi:RNA polymerase sigma-70 factor (ECF subfamily)|nr:RNA polymerase sigma factor [Sandaracinaceae bacterium]